MFNDVLNLLLLHISNHNRDKEHEGAFNGWAPGVGIND
jgi:hypothetical protein